MRIKKLSLTNWRSLSKANLNLGKVNFIFGKNNEGKSSIIYGLEYALTNGSSISNDLSKLQKYGTNECGTAVDVDKLGVINRYKKTGNQINRFNNDLASDKDIAAQISKTFGLDYDTISIMFDTSRFTSMSKKEQKAFLLRLTGVSLNADKVIEYMEKPTDAAKDMVRKSINNATCSIDDLEKLRSTYFTTRTKANKELKELTDTLKVLRENLPQDKPREIKFINEDIAKLDKVLMEIEKTLTIYNERVKQKTTLEKNIAIGEENYAKMEQKLNSKVPTTQDYIDKMEVENKAMLDKKSKNDKEIGSCNANIKNANETLRKLDTTKCPLADAIVCTFDKKPMQDKLKEDIATWEKKLVSLNEENTKISETLELNAKKKKAIEAQIKVVEWLANAKKELDSRKEDLKKIELPTVDGFAKKKEENETNRAMYKKELSFAEKYIFDKSKIEEKEKALESKKAYVELLDYLVTEFSPNGVRSRILKKIITPVEEVANERLNILTPGYSIRFSFDNDFDLEITNKTGTLNFEQLSVSEQLRIQVILQDAINQLTNVGIMVVDETSALDDENFILLLDLIKEIQEGYGNIFIIATKKHEDIVKLSEHLLSTSDDTHIFYIENNQVQTI